MDSSRARRNPFTPGYGGRVPPLLAGREEEKERILLQVMSVLDGDHSARDTFLVGPRGTGKTTLLNWLGQHVGKGRKSGAIASSARIGKPVSEIDNLEKISELFLRKSLFSGLSSVDVRAKIMGGSFEFKDDRYIGSIERIYRQTRRSPLVVLIDEAHEIEADKLNRLFHITQDARNCGSPVMVVMAGTPQLRDKLESAQASFVERGVEVEVGPIERESSREAIELPLKDFGNIRIENGAIEKVLDEAQCYPYFVQLWGQALWQQAQKEEKHELQMADVEKCKRVVEGEKAQLYQRRFQRWDARELGALTEVARRLIGGSKLGRHGIVKVCEMALESSGQDAAGAIDVYKKLVNEGVIWKKTGEENYGPGIPSFLNHVVEQEVSRKRQDREFDRGETR